MATIYYRLEVFCEILDMPRPVLRRIERTGLLAPTGEPEHEGGKPRYTEQDLRRARRIRRLQRDLGLNMAGVEIATRLLDQIEGLQRLLDER